MVISAEVLVRKFIPTNTCSETSYVETSPAKTSVIVSAISGLGNANEPGKKSPRPTAPIR